MRLPLNVKNINHGVHRGTRGNPYRISPVFLCVPRG